MHRLLNALRSPGRTLFSTFVVLLALLLIWWLASQWYQTQLLTEARAQADVEVSLRANALSLAVNRRLTRLQSLHAFTQVEAFDPDFASKFETFATELYIGTNNIRNFAIAPGNTVQYVYPLAGNESVIGYQPLLDPRPEVSADAQRAIDTGRIILTGPIELVQGGFGLIARQAIYIEGVYWGLVNVVLDLPPMLEEAEIEPASATYDFVVRDDALRVFSGDESVFEREPIVRTIDLPEGFWVLAGVPHEGWLASVQEPMSIFQVGGLIIMTLLSGLTYLTINRQTLLAQAVAERTREISSINEQLQEDIAARKHVEEALRASETELRALFAAMPDVILVLNAEGRYLKIAQTNPSFARLPSPDLIGQTLYDVFAAEQADTYLRQIRQALETRQTIQSENNLVVDGEEVWYSASVSPMTDDTVLLVTRDITRRRRMEAALQTSEARFRSAFDGAATGMALVAPDNRYLRVNDAYCRIVGYSKEELLAMTFTSITHPEDIDTDVSRFHLLLDGEIEHYAVEKRFIHKKGHTVWSLLSVSLVRDPQGQPLYSVSQVQDITERKHAEQELRTSQQQYEQLVNTIDGIVWEGDAQTFEYSFVSRQAERMLGYPIERWTSEPDFWVEHIHPDDREWAVNFCVIATAEMRPHEFEYRMVAADGRTVWLRDIVTVVVENDRPALLRGLMIDVTERKRVEKALREREDQYRSIFESSTDGLFINDLNGHLVDFNPAAAHMHGYSVEEFRQLQPEQFIHRDSLHLFTEYIEAVKAGEQYHCQAQDLRKDGSWFHIEIFGTGFTYKGQPHALAVVRDVTERVHAQQLLEQRVEERTRELAALLEVSRNVASTLELKPLLGLILDQLKMMVNYDGAAIFTIEEDMLTLLSYWGPISQERARQTRAPLPQAGVNGEVVRRGQPIIIDNVRDDTPLAQAYRAASGSEMDTTFNYVQSWMGVPLNYKDRPVGMMSFHHRTPGYYTAHHASLALAIANQAAVAIENARLYAQAQSLAALEERQRLARELHDSVSQALYGIALGSRAARKLLNRDTNKSAEALDYVLSLAEAGLSEMRALIFELRPESLEKEGLVAALEKQAASIHTRHQVEVQTSFCDEPPASPAVKEALYRVAQEALNNVVKHARAERVELQLTWNDGRIGLDVRDHGIGFDTGGSFPGHLGLQSMRERIERLNGAFEIDSTPGVGTHVHVSMPLEVER